jgi:riboflavin synthase
MFTGIIEELGTIVELNNSGTSLCLKIEAERVFSKSYKSAQSDQNGLIIGDSIAINGICLTATDVRPPYFEVTAVKETLGKTTLRSLIAGNEDNLRMSRIAHDARHTKVNLERAAMLETRLGGHLVQGHIDGVAAIRNIRDLNGSWEFSFELSPEMMRFVVPKGSIAIEGISLTVAAIEGDLLTVAIIPHTYYHTTFQFLKIGDMVNIELDIIAKMVERLVKPYRP